MSSSHNQDTQEKNNFATYNKRPGTSDCGKEYEYMMCGLYALKLFQNKDVENFRISTNEEIYGDFDDIFLEVTYKDQTVKSFLLQLKHIESTINKSDLISENKSLSLKKYIKTFKTLEIDKHFSCILYTTANMNVSGNFVMNILDTTANMNVSGNCVMNSTDANVQIVNAKLNQTNEETRSNKEGTSSNKKGTGSNKQGTSSNEENIILPSHMEILVNDSKFKQKTKSSKGKKGKPVLTDCTFKFKIQDEQNFSNQFYLFTDQDDYPAVNATIKSMLNELLEQDIFVSFANFMKDWWSSNIFITKHNFITKLTELALSPSTKPISCTKLDNQSELIQKSVMEFDLTIVKNVKNEIIANIWPIFLSCTEEEIFSSWDKAPLIVTVNKKNEKQVSCALNLLRNEEKKRKIVLLGEITKELEQWKTFKNLSDLKEINEKIFGQMLNTYKISLQGREPIKLKEFVNGGTNTLEVVTVDDLLEMSQKEFLKFGDFEQNQIDAYIPRKISTTVVNLDMLLENLKHVHFIIIIINCNEAMNRYERLGISVKENCLKNFLNEKISAQSKLILLPTDKKCSFTEFDTLCTRNEDSSFYLLDRIDEHFYRVVLKRGNTLPEDQLTYKEAEEANAFKFCNNELNLICAPAGMGKSTLFKTLQRNCPKDFWCLSITLIEHNEFFKPESSNEDMLEYFLKLDDSQHDFEIKKVLFENKKMYVFLDGLDEVDNDCIRTVLDFVKYLSSAGCPVWVSSRPNLEEMISNFLYAVPITVNELSRSEQEEYIRKRLRSLENSKVEEFVEKIFKVADMGTSQQLLGVPLLLFMITECIIDNNPLLDFDETKGLVLTKIYKAFFEGKKKFLYQKTEIEGKEIQIGYSFNHQLKLYYVPALKSSLSSAEVKKLTVGVGTQEMEYLEQIEKEGDKFGIIQKVKTIQVEDNLEDTINAGDESKKMKGKLVIFVHQTFAEYFACVWFCRNMKRMHKINQEMFLRKNQNLRTMFDIMLAEDSPLHLAIIYRDFEQVEMQYQKEFVDKGNRNFLYLMCSYGTNCFPLRNYHFERLNREDQFYQRIVSKLITQCQDISTVDNIYNFSYLEYSIRSCCLYPLEVVLQMGLLDLESIKKLIQLYPDTSSLLVYITQFGYPNLLHLVIRNITENDIYKTYYWGEGKSLLEVAALGCKNDNYESSRKGNLETVALLVQYFDELKQKTHDQGRRTNRTNLDGEDLMAQLLDLLNDEPTRFPEWELLKLVCQVKCNEMIHYLAPKIIYTSENHDTFLHSCVNFGTLTEEIVQIAKQNKIINARNDLGKTALHLACKSGNSVYVRWFLEYDADIDIVDELSRNVLHYVASSSKENVEILDLFSFCKFIDQPDNRGETPLHFACRYGYLNYVKKFFEKDDYSDLVDNKYANLLHCAAEAYKNNVELIEFLKLNGVDPGATTQRGEIPLHKACEDGMVENIKALIDKTNAKKLTKNGDSAFHCLGRNQTFKISRAIDLLLRYGLDINARNKDGHTPLYIAIYEAEILQINENIISLLEKGADINSLNAIDTSGQTLLHELLETSENCSELIDCLVKKGISVNIPNKYGNTPLHEAINYYNPDCIQLLLDNGADPNITNKSRMNTLHYIANISEENKLNYLEISTKIFSEIMHKVTNKNLQDNTGKTALQLAAENNHFDFMKFLLEKQVDVNLCDKYGNNLLHVLVDQEPSDDCKEVVKILTNRGIDLNARNKKKTNTTTFINITI